MLAFVSEGSAFFLLYHDEFESHLIIPSFFSLCRALRVNNIHDHVLNGSNLRECVFVYANAYILESVI